ncbi:hypothetical protein [Leifsonia aquatica]|uniref:hypothetical protein n=1 Tax=Leifsonia aquatica TaxID=144185 RepID=UPI0037F36ACA
MGKSRGTRRSRVAAFAGALAALGVAASVGVAGVPAQAVGANAFEIFYSPGCTGASRGYEISNGKEPWINDVFDRNTHGSAGYGQKIYKNAASIYLRGTTPLAIWGPSSSMTWALSRTDPGTCYNLGALRNQNMYFQFNG